MDLIAYISLGIAIFYAILGIVFIVLLVKFTKENKRKELLTKQLLEIEAKREQEETERLWREMKLQEEIEKNEKEIY